MKIYLIAIFTICAGCSTVNCNFHGDYNKVQIEQPKTVQTNPSVQADGNTVPLR